MGTCLEHCVMEVAMLFMCNVRTGIMYCCLGFEDNLATTHVVADFNRLPIITLR